MKLIRSFKLILLITFLALCLCLVGCLDDPINSDTSNDDASFSDTGSISESQSSSESTTESTTESTDAESSTESEAISPDESESRGYFLANVAQNASIIASPYTDDMDVSEELKGIYYSSDAPGGSPKKDGTGKIWLVLKPIRNQVISNIKIEGEYSSIENLGGDLYCVHGVKSDLSVSVSTKVMPSEQKEIFASYGYGISDDGKMVVTWLEDPQDPLRYVELRYNDGLPHIEYIDASLGSVELFQMVENKAYSVTMRAVGYKYTGQSIEVSGCYMKAPKDVPFPRVEITTENFVWPDCDFVSSPEGCWGAGITNAFYEQCVMTIYNEDNEIVYNSSTNLDENKQFLGAKMKIRGNTSARHEYNSRFPYKIKLDKKADLLEPLIGRPDSKEGYADKDWLLLNYGNDGFRVCGDAIADAVGREWSPDYCYVSLYVNGEYRGLYVLSEAVEEGSSTGEDGWRVNVANDGYVFECDAYWWNEDFSFATPLTEDTPMHFTFKYPDSDRLTEDSPEYKYLRDYLIAFEDALMKDDDSYLDYIDLDSFVKWLLVSDYLCIEDGGGCNIFLYKSDSTDSSKLAMGPNWDFDSYMGNVTALSTIRLKWNGAPFYYQYLIRKDSFQTRYKELLAETSENLISYVENSFTKIDVEAHSKLLEYENTRFGTSKKPLSTIEDDFIAWLNEHLEWMEEQFK